MFTPSGTVTYTGPVPVGVDRSTQQDNINESSYQLSEPNVDISRYIDASVGGKTGVVNPLGYSTGLNNSWYSRFAGGMVRFTRRNLAKDTGPVGRDNNMGNLQAGVASQTAQYPSMQAIARSIVGLPAQDGV